MVAKPVLQVIIGSTRPGRVGPAVADWIIERARARGDFEVVVTDLAELNLPLFDEPNEIMEQAAAVMLDELARWTEALRPLRPMKQ